MQNHWPAIIPAMKGRILTIRFAILLAASWLTIACGCHKYSVNEKRSPGIVLPKSQMESDSVAVRVAIAEFDDQQKEDFESFIDTTDQKLPYETRRRLDENGLRVSVVSNINSSQLQRLLTPQIPKREWLTQQELELEQAGKLEPVYRLVSQRHVEKKRGESFNVEVSPTRAQSSWEVFDEENELSDDAELAQCQMRITSWPQPDGSVKVHFLPEVHHGQKVSRIGSVGQNFAVQQSRDVKSLRSLEFELTVRPGEAIVVAPTGGLERIGSLFFNAGDDVKLDEAIEDSFEVESSKFFPMLEQEVEPESLDASVLVEIDALEDDASEISTRPKPWQRVLLVRIADVTSPSVPGPRR